MTGSAWMRMLLIAGLVGASAAAGAPCALAQYYQPQPYQPPAPIQNMAPAFPQMNSQTYGNQTYYNGQMSGQPIDGTSQTYGNQTYTHLNGPAGQTNCTTQRYGNQAYTHCQ